jgi:hypothetical protein
MHFTDKKDNVREVLKNGDICKPVGYKPPKRKFDEIRIDKEWMR